MERGEKNKRTKKKEERGKKKERPAFVVSITGSMRG